MRFGTWNVRSLYRKCLLKAGASELAKYDLDREAIKGVRFVEGGCQPADDYKRAVCKVRGLALLLRVGTSWRCGDGLFFKVPPLASDAILTKLHPLLRNMLQTVCHKLQEDSGTGDFLASKLPFHGWKSPEIAWGEIWTP
jgi:hypothetical protein